MDIKPNDSWYWYFSDTYDRLMLDLSGQILFRSRLAANQLNQKFTTFINFDLDDTQRFFTFDDNCHCLGLPKSQHMELVLNAVAAAKFLKPAMPKSWYFNRYDAQHQPVYAEIMAVNLIDTQENALLLVIESNEKASTCLVAQTVLPLANKTYYFGEPMIVMNDRLLPVIFNEESANEQVSFALAI